MPHVIIKLYPGRTEAEKSALADRLAEVLNETLAYRPGAVSVVIQEVAPDRWMEDVYEPDIRQRQAELVRWPDYGPLSRSARKGDGRSAQASTPEPSIGAVP